MTPYVIFAISLTAAYIIYYGYNISRDLYGKKGSADNTEETFDVGLGDNEPVATPVMETATGFSLGENTGQKEPSPNDTQQSTENRSKPSASDRLKAIEERLEETDVESSDPKTADELNLWLMQQDARGIFHNPKPIIRQHRDHC